MSLQELTRRNLRCSALSGPKFTWLLHEGQWLFRERRVFLKEIIATKPISFAGCLTLVLERLWKTSQPTQDRSSLVSYIRRALPSYHRVPRR